MSDSDSDNSGSESDVKPQKGAKGDTKRKAAAPKGKATKASTKAASKTKAKRAKKDPDAPKKPQTAFILFSNAHRDEVKSKNPSASFGETGKLLGEAWADASAEEKEKYQKQADAAKKDYEKVKAAYDSKNGGKSAKKAAPKKATKKEESESESGSDSDE
eukprot:EC715450.1.p1 GENE.EC715450.1~~EC715450.1.p1  ORF type:complete len:160 (+),score=48.31 EC715450.1:14-493(+)